MRILASLTGLTLVLVLAACNSTSQTVAPPPPAIKQQSGNLISDPNFKLPDEPGCAGHINRFQALIDNDLQTGHTTQTVRDDISASLSRIAAPCSAGDDAGASASVVALRRKFGYPTS